jgi:ABC-type bacteriocin/lantibiotic exporter with double-glycine peptidase domain
MTPGHDDTHHPSPLRRLLGLMASERRDLAVVALYAVAIGVLNLAIPFTAMIVVNTTAMGTLMQQLIVLCGVLLACLLMAAGLRTLQLVVVEYVQRRVFVRMVDDLSHRLPHVDVRAFDGQHGPELVNRFFDVLTMQKAAATLLLDGLAVILQVIIGLVLLGFYHQILLGFDLFLIAGLSVIVFVLGWRGPRTAIAESMAKYRVAGWIEELARHPEAFKVSGGAKFARERADALTAEYLAARRSHFRVVGSQFASALLLQAAASTALLAIGGWLVIQEKLSLGQLVAAEIVVTLVVGAFTKLAKQLEIYYDLLAATDKIGYLIDLPLERTAGAAHPGGAGGADLRVHAVAFAYDHEHGNVLQDFSLHVRPGERVAVVGAQGSGKSTLLDLLFGLRTPDRGYVELDGLDLRDVRLESLRDQIAMVKGIEAFDGTLLDNVRMGRDRYGLPEVRDVLAAVRLLDDVAEFPDGLNMTLVAGGAPLSVGQAQRLMLARAILGKPRLLVLDETLDAMPPAMREQVLPDLFDRRHPWTVVVVTHKPDVAKACDRTVTLVRPSRTAQADRPIPLAPAETNGQPHSEGSRHDHTRH